MENNQFFKNYASFVSFQPDRYGKAALFGNEHIFVGLNCLEPGQEMEKHAHDVQSRFYIVLEGNGHVWVGDEHQETGAGAVIWVPPGYSHRIVNNETERMVLLVGFAPLKAD